jgi:hypothetical protein
VIGALARITREEAEPRFRAYLEEEEQVRVARGERLHPPQTDKEFEAWSWQPFLRFRGFVEGAATPGVDLLIWYR